MKLHFSNATASNWEFTLTDTPGAAVLTLPPGLSQHTFTASPGALLMFGPAGDGLPHSLSRRVTAGDSDTVAVIYVFEKIQHGREIHEHIFSDPPIPPEEN